LYVRERILPGTDTRDLPNKVVLFVHGAGTPAEVAFDVSDKDYSWMDYLAQRGFDTFSVDMTGYGRSTRPLQMNDRCNLSAAQQQTVFGSTCEANFKQGATTLASDWDDLDAVVNYLLKLRNVETVHLVAWSLGGPRAGGYAALHPDKVSNLVLLAPAYIRATPATLAEAPLDGDLMNTQNETEFFSNWDRQVGCLDQYDSRVGNVIWKDMLASDPVGATWGTGVRRAPRTVNFGWTPEMVGGMQTPVLMVAGVQDKQVNPDLVKALYDDIGSDRKVYLEMECSSHNAMWEEDAQQLFNASYQWLTGSSYDGQTTGMIQLKTSH